MDPMNGDEGNVNYESGLDSDARYGHGLVKDRRVNLEMRKAYTRLECVGSDYGFISENPREFYLSVLSGFKKDHPGLAMLGRTFVEYAAGKLFDYDQRKRNDDNALETEISRMEGRE